MDDLAPIPIPSAHAIDIAPGVYVPESGLRVQYARSSGPGGQNVNKVNSKAEIWVRVVDVVGLDEASRLRLATLAGRRLTDAGEIHIVDQSSRSRETNRMSAIARFVELIMEAMKAPKARRATRPSRAAKRRRLDSKKRRAGIKAGRRAGSEE